MQDKACKGQEKFLYLGQAVSMDQYINVSNLNEEELMKNIKKFYISTCKNIVKERVKIYEKQLKVKARSIKVDESKRNWGTCTSNKEIAFNYRLAMLPMEYIDYIVVHELCHILHMNHERSFWRKVGSVLPDYKRRQEDLKKYGLLMIL